MIFVLFFSGLLFGDVLNIQFQKSSQVVEGFWLFQERDKHNGCGHGTVNLRAFQDP